MASYTKGELLSLLVDMITHHSPVKDMAVVVKTGLDVNLSHKNGLRPLHYAAYHDYTEAIAFLIDEAKGDVNVEDDVGYTPLHLASKHGHVNAVRTLLRHGACVNFSGSEVAVDCGSASRALAELTIEPLSLAIENNHVECEVALLEHGADPNRKYFVGHVINMAPIEHWRCIEALLLYGADPDVFSRGGLSPLMRAAKCGQLASVEVLLRHGASVNLQCPPRFDRKTALHFAAASGHVDVVKALLDAGAATCRPPGYDRSALQVALVGDKWSAVEVLLEYGASVDETTDEGCSPLQMAVSTLGLGHQTDLIESLLRHGADPNHHAAYFSYVGPSLSPLVEYFCYTESYDVGVVRLLLAYGSKVNMTRPTKLLKIRDPYGMLGQVRKLRPYEQILDLLLDAAESFDVEAIRNESSLSNKQKQMLVTAGSVPRELRHLVRLKIRQSLSRPILPKINQLPLPVFLKNYLSFNL